MRKSRAIFAIFLAALLLWMPAVVHAQSTTDVIRDYRIDLQPQDDASLINTYTINWCVISNALGPLNDFYVGMPNENYQVLDFSGDARDVRSADKGAYTQVNVVLTRPVSANDCANVTFRIHQMGIAHLDSTKGEIGFQFIPGWFDEIQVEHLQLTWHLPTDSAQLKSVTPEPKTKDAGTAVWETSLQPGGKFTINLLYDKAAFPNFGKESTPVGPLPGSSASTTTESTNGPIEFGSSTGQPTANTAEPLLGGFLPITLVTCICALLIFIFIIMVLVSIFSSGVRSYHGGSTIGGSRPGGGPIFIPLPRPRSGGGIFGGGGGSSSPPPSRSGGGSGLFGGRGSSCACVSCACACACAGGGRAGCSRKGFDISGLINKTSSGEVR